ncbi:MAG TPA: aspartate aminotransferase family protein [Candidatus Acidoferrales bacterium]|nr:aspartate aminotransferase family protein [Candidatus Acidoferrales bacterium]
MGSAAAPAPETRPAESGPSSASHLMNTYRRPATMFERGRGCYLYDSQDRRYLDFITGIGVNALGYAHPRLVRVMRREAGRLVHLSNLYHHPFQEPLAAKLAGWSGLDRVFFANSGTEAIEGALKLARAHARRGGQAKPRVLALENSFHGRTVGALAVTATAEYREPFAPLMPGAGFVRLNDVADLEAKFGDDVCAILIEPIQGEGGIHRVSEPFWRRARELATQHGAALIADEIQCGLGRTGRYFACQNYEGKPDILTVAKPLAGGLPLGALVATEEIASALAPGMHGSTFGGGPLACAVALEFLTTVEEENLLENVARRGAEIREGLQRLAARAGFVREVRGEGLMLAMELEIEGGAYVDRARELGLLVNCTHKRVLRFLPPYIADTRHVTEFLRKMKRALAGKPPRRDAGESQPQSEPAAGRPLETGPA